MKSQNINVYASVNVIEMETQHLKTFIGDAVSIPAGPRFRITV